MLAIDKIYVAHYAPLIDRKQNLLKQLDNYKIEAEWMQEEPSEDEFRALTSIDLWDSKFKSMGNANYEPHRQLKKSEFSLCFKHLKIYEDIIKNNIRTSLILEDDVVFSENFINNFNLNICMTPKDWDFIFIGSGCGLEIDKKTQREGQVAYKKEHPASKCTDSYVIKLSSAQKLINTLDCFTFPIDFELNYQMFKHNMNVYWWQPPVTKQGSQSGMYRSEIQ
jgi:GR25 family glycosyltransferase involved in LPS biosynthesis